MKKILLAMFMVAFLPIGICHADDNVVFFEDFEKDEYEDFSSTKIGNWIAIDRDKQECWGFLNTTLLVKPEINLSPVLNSFLLFNTDQYIVKDPEEYVADYSAHSGKKAMLANSILVVDSNADDWLISPGIDLGADNYIINFWAKEANGENSNVTFKVLITDQEISSAKDFKADDFEVVNNGTVSLSSYLNAGSYGNWLQFAFEIDEKYRDKTVRIAINHVTSGASGAQYFMIDDFQVITSGCLATAENIRVSDVLDKEATVSWVGNGDKYEVEYGKAGFKRGNSEESTILLTSENKIILKDLEPYSNYEVFVTASCSEESSLIAGKKAAFKTDIYVDPVTVTAEEGYEFGFEVDDLYPNGWRIETPTGEGAWKHKQVSSQGIGSVEGKMFMAVNPSNDSNEASDTWLFSRGISLVENQEVIISFWVRSPDEPSSLKVTISDDFKVKAHTDARVLFEEKSFGEEYKAEYKLVSIPYKADRTGTHYIGFYCFASHRWAELWLDLFSVVDASSVIVEEYVELIKDDFENYANFAVSGIGKWTTINSGNKEKIIVENVDFSNNGSSTSFMVFNESAVSGNIDRYSFAAHSGNKAMVSFSTKEGKNDDWFISERVLLGAKGNVVSFWAKVASVEAPKELFDVLVSTEETNANNFDSSLFESLLSEPVNMQEYIDSETGAKWIKFAYSLDNYEKESIQVAINRISAENSFALLIDDFKITKGSYVEAVENVRVWESGYLGGIQLTWDSGIASQYEVQYGEKGFEVETGESVFTSSRNAFVDELEGNREYEFYVRPYSVDGIASELWVGPYNVLTEAKPMDIKDIYSFGFEEVSFEKEGWRAERGWSQIVGDEQNAYEGDSYVLFKNNSKEAYDYYFLFIRPFNLYKNHEYVVSFAYKTTTIQENLTIAMGYKFTGETEVYPFWAVDNVKNTEYETAEVKLTIPADDSMYLAFTCYSETDGEDIEVLIDNIVIVDIDLSSIENSNTDALNLNVYPNPTTDVLNISLPDTYNKETAKVVVTDMAGRVVKQAAYTQVFNVSDLNAGVYNITVTDANNKQNQLFIKK